MSQSPHVPRRARPWNRWGLSAAMFAVGGVAGWLLTSYISSSTNSASTATSATETITVAIPDKSERLSPDFPEQRGIKDRVEIPDAALEKLARLLRPPSPSLVSTWGPPVSALVVSLIALKGVRLAADKAAETALETAKTDRESDGRSEWFRRFKEMLDLALSKDGDRSQIGSKLLQHHVTSTLAGVEETELARDVLEHIFKPALEEAAKPGESDVRFVVRDPSESP